MDNNEKKYHDLEQVSLSHFFPSSLVQRQGLLCVLHSGRLGLSLQLPHYSHPSGHLLPYSTSWPIHIRLSPAAPLCSLSSFCRLLLSPAGGCLLLVPGPSPAEHSISSRKGSLYMSPHTSHIGRAISPYLTTTRLLTWGPHQAHTWRHRCLVNKHMIQDPHYEQLQY